MNSTPIRIALVDSHLLLLESLATRLESQSDMQVLWTATTADEALESMMACPPDVCILDVDLPGRGAFEIAAAVRARLKGTRLLFLSGHLSDVFLEQALRLKAHGYLMKDEPVEVFFNAVRTIGRGSFFFSEEVEKRLEYETPRKRYILHSTSHLSSLTNRQLEVLRHLARGESVKEVARTLHLSQKSVDSHKYRIMHKLKIHDRVLLTRFAIREGLMLP